MNPVSIREVALRAGVSRATVSRVLNGNTESLVAEPTRERVRRVAAELGYYPSAVARGLAGKPMNTVGVVLAYILPSVTADPYLGPVLDGILIMDKLRHQKTVIFAENDWQEASERLSVYSDGHCDGLIVVIPRRDAPLVPALKRSRLPFVLIGDNRDDPDVSVVDMDNTEIAREVVAYLLTQGHRRIAVLCGNREFASSDQRLEGYRRAHHEANAPMDEALVMPGEYWEWSGYENTERLMRLPSAQRPTALFCSNGRIATGTLHALHDLGIRVPDEVSVAAIHESAETAASSRPALTAAHMSLRQIGERAVETLLSQIHDKVPAGQKVLLPGELTLRESVAPPSRQS